MTRRLSFVAEITVVVDSSGTQQTFYFGTEGWATKPGDTPADTVIPGLLADAGSYRQELFSGARVTGASRPSFGQLILNNSDGGLDGWLDYGVSAGLVTVRYGDIADAYPDGWTTVYVAYAYALIVDFSEVRVLLRDRAWLLDKPVVTDVFGAITGLEATVSARKKQIVFGRPGYIPPILLNGPKQVYFVQANATSHRVFNPTAPEFTAFDGGVALTFGGYYETAEEGIADDGAPDPGEFKVYADGVDPDTMESTGPLYLRLGSPPEYDVRYSPRGLLKNGTNDDARTWTFVDLCQRAGLTDVTADTLAPGSMMRTVGNFLCDGDQTYLQVMDDVASAYFTPYGFDRLDQFFTYRLSLGVDGDDASVYTFTTHNAKEFRRLPVPGMEAPIWQLHAKGGRTWPSSVATSLEDAGEREEFTREIATVFTASSQSARTANPGAETGYVEIIGREFDALWERQQFAARYFHLFGARRDLLMVTARLDASTIAINLHDKVTVQMPRLCCDAGRLFRVITTELNLRNRTATFGLWGGDAGPTDWVIGDDSIGGGSGASDFNPYLKSIGDFYFVGGRAAATVGGPTGSTSKSIGDFTLDMSVTVQEVYGVDEHWADVLFYCPMSSDFNDISTYERTFTAAGGAAVTSAVQLWGGDTGQFTTTLDEATTTDVTDLILGSADFTLEFMVYLPSTNGAFSRRIGRLTHSSGYSLHVYVNSSDAVGFIGSNGSSQIATQVTSALTVGAWTHVAFGRSGNVVCRALAGTVGDGGGSSFVGSLNTNSVVEMQFGNEINNSDLSPKIHTAHWRLTKNVWRYPTNFTPPVFPFPAPVTTTPPAFDGTWSAGYDNAVTVSAFAFASTELASVFSDVAAVTVTASGSIPGIAFGAEYGGVGATVDQILMVGTPTAPGVYSITLTYRLTDTYGTLIETSTHTITIE